jgi:hypothetical protein
MEEKHNLSTKQRPEGARPLDAALIPIDINKFSNQIKAEEAYERNGKNAITVFKSEKVTITLIALKADENFHPGKEDNVAIMSLQVISGQLLFESLGNEINLNDGQFLTLHQELSFKATAKTDILCLLTMIM